MREFELVKGFVKYQMACPIRGENDTLLYRVARPGYR